MQTPNSGFGLAAGAVFGWLDQDNDGLVTDVQVANQLNISRFESNVIFAQALQYCASNGKENSSGCDEVLSLDRAQFLSLMTPPDLTFPSLDDTAPRNQRYLAAFQAIDTYKTGVITPSQLAEVVGDSVPKKVFAGNKPMRFPQFVRLMWQSERGRPAQILLDAIEDTPGGTLLALKLRDERERCGSSRQLSMPEATRESLISPFVVRRTSTLPTFMRGTSVESDHADEAPLQPIENLGSPKTADAAKRGAGFVREYSTTRSASYDDDGDEWADDNDQTVPSMEEVRKRFPSPILGTGRGECASMGDFSRAKRRVKEARARAIKPVPSVLRELFKRIAECDDAMGGGRASVNELYVEISSAIDDGTLVVESHDDIMLDIALSLSNFVDENNTVNYAGFCNALRQSVCIDMKSLSSPMIGGSRVVRNEGTLEYVSLSSLRAADRDLSTTDDDSEEGGYDNTTVGRHDDGGGEDDMGFTVSEFKSTLSPRLLAGFERHHSRLSNLSWGAQAGDLSEESDLDDFVAANGKAEKKSWGSGLVGRRQRVILRRGSSNNSSSPLTPIQNVSGLSSLRPFS